jgi:carbon starvation protein
MFHPKFGWWQSGDYLLLSIGIAVLCLQVWMIVEGILVWPRAKGMLEVALPPLPKNISGKSALETAVASGGRSC